MGVVIINPNSTVSMTQAMLAHARKAAPHQNFEGWTSHDGPPAIQGPQDGDAATKPLLQLVDQASKSGANGIIIGCFDDTALDQAAESTPPSSKQPRVQIAPSSASVKPHITTPPSETGGAAS